MCYVKKLEYFFKSCKTENLNATSDRQMSVKKHYMEPIQVECMMQSV